MNKFLKGTAVFAAGLGASLIIGWWLKNRDEQAAQQSDHPMARFGLDYQPSPDDIGAITLPPEAFADLDEDNIPPMVIRSTTRSADDEAEEEKAAGSPDDLTQIKGIGAKTAEALHDLGITTFAALAEADPNQIKAHVSRASLQTVEGWIKTARKHI